MSVVGGDFVVFSLVVRAWLGERMRVRGVFGVFVVIFGIWFLVGLVECRGFFGRGLVVERARVGDLSFAFVF